MEPLLQSSAAGLLLFVGALGDEESLEEEELEVSRGHDEQTEDCGHPGDVLRVGQQQVVVSALPHPTVGVVSEHVENVGLHFVGGLLQTQTRNK